MLLSLCRVTAGRTHDWPGFVELAGHAGFDAVDVDLDPALNAGATATLDLLASHALQPGGCGLPVEFRCDESAFRDTLATLPKYARLAADLGCPRMATWVPPAFDAPANEMRPLLIRRWTRIAEVLTDYGVRLGLEFITPQHLRASGHPCIWSMADMLTACTECGQNVGLLLDSWHWHHDPVHTTDAIRDAGRERIVAVHLNDTADEPPEQVRDDRRLLPGEGVIDLPGFLRALRDVGYRDAITLEVFGRLDDLADEQAARQAYTAGREALAKI